MVFWEFNLVWEGIPEQAIFELKSEGQVNITGYGGRAVLCAEGTRCEKVCGTEGTETGHLQGHNWNKVWQVEWGPDTPRVPGRAWAGP